MYYSIDALTAVNARRLLAHPNARLLTHDERRGARTIRASACLRLCTGRVVKSNLLRIV